MKNELEMIWWRLCQRSLFLSGVFLLTLLNNQNGLVEGQRNKIPVVYATRKPPLKDCPQPVIGSTDDLFKKNQFIRTWGNSKYLYPKEQLFMTHQNAMDLCHAIDLEPAVIDTLADFQQISKFIYKNKLNNTRSQFALALGGITGSDGQLIDVTTNRPFPFQAFRLRDDDTYFEPNVDCLSLYCFGGVPCYFKGRRCEQDEVMPFCQYPRSTPCHQYSPYGLFAAREQDELYFAGATETRLYYGGRKQKTFTEAVDMCTKNGFQLFSFRRNDTTGDREGVVHEVIGGYRNRPEFKAVIPKWTGLSWIGGQFTEGYGRGNPIHFVDGEVWSYQEIKNQAWKWRDRAVRDPSKETCLLLLDEGRVRPVACNMKHYYLCWMNRPTPQPRSSLSDFVEEEEPDEETGSNCPGDPAQLSFSVGGFTNEEIVELIKNNIYFQFDTGYAMGMNIKPESTWRIPHVKMMGKMTKFMCSAEYVSHQFVNVLINLIMVYYNSIPEFERPPQSVSFWDQKQQNYGKCLENQTESMIGVRGLGGLISKYAVKGKGGEEEIQDVVIVAEKADSFPVLDVVLEGLWYMFQITAAQCYKQARSKTIWLAEYFFNFRNDWTELFRNWWEEPGVTNYGLLFGDMDLYQQLYNIRACAVAAFQNLNIADRFLVRPVKMGDDENSITSALNHRLTDE